MIQNPIHLQRHVYYLWYIRSSVSADKFSTQKHTKYTNATCKIDNIVTIITTTQYWRPLYLRTNRQLPKYWYHSTTWNTSTNPHIISYYQCDIFYHQKDHLNKNISLFSNHAI